MQVFALFESSSTLDKSISHLKSLGVASHDLFVVPFKGSQEDVEVPIDKRYPQGKNYVDKGFAFATGVSVITAGIGFSLPLGPIIWGIAGAIGGFLLGVLINCIQMKRKGQVIHKKNRHLPFILIINSEVDLIGRIERTLYENGALGVNTPLLKDSNH